MRFPRLILALAPLLLAQPAAAQETTGPVPTPSAKPDVQQEPQKDLASQHAEYQAAQARLSEARNVYRKNPGDAAAREALQAAQKATAQQRAALESAAAGKGATDAEASRKDKGEAEGKQQGVDKDGAEKGKDRAKEGGKKMA
ncbi:MAG: hypothetical protein O3A95_02060 [Planctomycetota bacterium]|nr:hypothetical protein [Planctomycetota bacterium]MDA1113067.1 hypothetical protein [Planctomycetota bacterium]